MIFTNMDIKIHFITFGAAILVAVIGALLQAFIPKIKEKFNWKVYAYILIAVFALRYFSYRDVADSVVGSKNGPFSSGLILGGYFGVWFELTLAVTLMIYPFIKLKTIQNFLKFIGPLLFLFYFIFSYQSLHLVFYGANEVVSSFIVPRIFFALETGLILFALIVVWFEDRTVNLSKEELLNLLYVFVPILLSTMPVYGLQIMVGPRLLRYQALDISFTHRIFMYISFIIPVMIMLVLKNKREDIIKFSMLFLSVATMITFSNIFYYKNFLEPWTWPIHLCNTAMYIVPITLIFKTERLFYFTYFINVLGALLAMLMPNYGEVTYTASEVIRFWYNHSIAFFMPLLLVGLGIYQRPKMRQMYYSMVAFSIYFMLVLFLNVTLEKYHSVDFFFLNGDFIVDKLGKGAKNIYRVKVSFTINDYEYVIRPLYQSLFLVVYEAASFAMWFVYSLGYLTHDYLTDLNRQKKQIKLIEYNLKNMQTEEQRKMFEENIDNIEASLVLENFSKKYGKNNVYAVKDASLVVNGGEIFGFLGPNGAGKSTTIKAIVGIHPITEGSISVCGFDVEKEGVKAKSLIGYVPDHYALYEKLTAREYINYIADIYGVSEERRTELIAKYIKMFNLEEAFDRQIKTFSHGMKQKVTIISALVHEPKLWLLDEPLTGLDPDSIFQVKECMKDHAAKGNIVMFSSHLIDVVENLCERVAIIKEGHLFAPVSIKEVQKTSTLEKYYLEKTV
ncbi:MAG TPA: ATP-binding cassette domain-containing protein [Bacilli bacterium]|nr:ATP-binding cassette domain-containing protein [Bacilli bacterium]